MNSFYGGKQGRTYHIVQRYDCVCMANFVQAFSSANTNTEKEYVEINSNIDSIENLKKGSLIYFEQNDSYYILTKDVIKEGNIYYIIQEQNQEQNQERIPITITNIDWLNEYGILIQGMVQCFAKGGSYSKVNYGQYVIIDTIGEEGGRSNPQNGLLFRRGFNYNQVLNSNEPQLSSYKISGVQQYDYEAFQSAWFQWVQNVGGGAEYIGQIVGPKGQPGTVEPVSWKSYKNMSTVSPGPNGQIINIKEISDIQGSLGKEEINGQTIYHDTIQVATYMVKDIYGNITESLIAFDIPITVFSFSAIEGSAYLPKNTELITRLNPIPSQGQEQEQVYHNFSYDYKITVPRGKKGDSLESFSIETNNNGSISPSIRNGNQLLVYKVRSYENSEEGKVIPTFPLEGEAWKKYCFPFKVIKDITSKERERDYYNKFKKENQSNVFSKQPVVGDIYQISSSNNLQAICIKNNNTTGQYSLPAGINQDAVPGTVIQDNDSAWYIMNISPSVSELDITYTYQTTDNDYTTIKPRFIDYLYSDAYGNIYVIYTDENETKQGHKIGSFNSIKSVNQGIGSDFNKITISYIQGNPQIFYTPKFDNLMESQKFKYDDGSGIKNLSDSFNYPIDIKRVGDNIAVLYLDPEIRKAIGENGQENIDYYILPYNDTAHNILYDGFDDNIENIHRPGDILRKQKQKGLVYKILSDVNGGFHILGNVPAMALVLEDSQATPPVQQGALAMGIQNYLNQEYKDRAGWVVTVTTEIETTVNEETVIEKIRTIYAFDYQLLSKEGEPYTITIDGIDYKTYWYPIQDINMSLLDPDHMYIISQQGETNRPAQNDVNLYENGLWFVLSTGHNHQ